MLNDAVDFLYAFKNRVIEAQELATKHSDKIKEYADFFRQEGEDKTYEENFLTILGYTYRLPSSKDRVYFTFQEAIYAIDLDKLMRNEDSLKLNTIVYILVMDFLLDEYLEKSINEEIKIKAQETYKLVEEKKAKENNKYHVYQY